MNDKIKKANAAYRNVYKLNEALRAEIENLESTIHEIVPHLKEYVRVSIFPDDGVCVMMKYSDIPIGTPYEIFMRIIVNNPKIEVSDLENFMYL